MLSRGRGHSAERRTVLLLAAVNLVALGSLAAPAAAAIPLKIDAVVPEEQRATALAAALGLGGLAALIANLLFGILSDRTSGRLGRRRPWMLGGVLSGLCSIAVLADADTFSVIVVSWICVQISYNATLAAAAALLADTVAEGKRAARSGVFTAAAFVGMLPPLLLVALLPRQIDVVVLVMPVIAVIVVGLAMTIAEKPSSAVLLESSERQAGPIPSRAARNARSAFAAVWLQRLAMQSAFSLASAFTVYLILDRMTSDAVAAMPIAMVATLTGGVGIVIGATVGGAWASKTQRYLPFLICGAVGLALGASLRAVTDTPFVLWIATGVGGIAVGVYLAVNLALAMSVLPTGREGRYLGMLNVAETIPQVLAPIAAAALLAAGSGDPISGASDNYALLYAVAVFVALSSLLILPTLHRATRVPAGVGAPSLGI